MCCPIHGEEMPSLKVYKTADRGWFCYGETLPQGRRRDLAGRLPGRYRPAGPRPRLRGAAALPAPAADRMTGTPWRADRRRGPRRRERQPPRGGPVRGRPRQPGRHPPHPLGVAGLGAARVVPAHRRRARHGQRACSRATCSPSGRSARRPATSKANPCRSSGSGSRTRGPRSCCRGWSPPARTQTAAVQPASAEPAGAILDLVRDQRGARRAGRRARDQGRGVRGAGRPPRQTPTTTRTPRSGGRSPRWSSSPARSSCS